MNKKNYELNEARHEGMTYDEFTETMRNSVAELLGESVEVILSTISKVNRPEVKTLSILSAGANTSPAVELDSYYNDFLDGEDIRELAEKIIDFCRGTGVSGNTDISFYTDFERAKEHIVCRLINAGMNERLLKQVPHLPYQDLAVVYYYQADNDARGGWSILVKNEQLKIWGISQEQLHMVAVENTSKKSFQIVPLSQVLWHLIGFTKPLEDDDQDVYDEVLEAESSIYILTNEEMCFGAVSIYFEDTLRKISRLIGGDYYILPSSLHECMILPVKNSGYMQAEQLQEMVREVNQKTVEIDDLLGDSVYRYDTQKEELTIAA